MKNCKSRIILLALCIFSTALTEAGPSNSDRFRFDLNLDEEGKLNPEVFIPIYWSQNWFSGFGYSDSTTLSQDVIDGFTDSRFGTSIDENTIRLNMLSYKAGSDGFSYSVGGDYQQTSIDKAEFGYFYLVTGTIDDYVAFDNTIAIEIKGFSLRGDLTWGKPSDVNRYRVTTILSPSNSLSVDQNTVFKPIVPTPGIGSSSESQDVSYLLRVETRHDLGGIVTVGLDAQYEVLPIKYDLLVLSSTANSFENATIDTTETTTRIGLRVISNRPLVEGLYPVVGIAAEDVETEDNRSGGAASESQTLLTVGFTGQF